MSLSEVMSVMRSRPKIHYGYHDHQNRHCYGRQCSVFSKLLCWLPLLLLVFSVSLGCTATRDQFPQESVSTAQTLSAHEERSREAFLQERTLKIAEKDMEMKTAEKGVRKLGMRRFLRGPGSSPPRCRSKCGRCRPCRVVRVVVKPGATTTEDYYPVAWRCQCRNRIFGP